MQTVPNRATVLLLISDSSNLVSRPSILTEIFLEFPQSLQGEVEIVAEIIPPPLTSASFLFHHSLDVIFVHSFVNGSIAVYWALASSWVP
jgi:hypothetical protein